MARAVGALKICQKKLQKHRVERMRLVATEACRRATNAAEFIGLVKRDTGLELEIIEPEEEARLAVVSCAPLVSTRTEQLLVVDIGGGSTELVWIDLSRVPRPDGPRRSCASTRGSITRTRPFPAPRWWTGSPSRWGWRRSRTCMRDVADDGARFALMSWYFEEQLADFSPYDDAADQAREGFQIIGTSGTVTTVAASHLGLRRYDRNKVDGLRMTSDQIDSVISQYLALGPEGRRRDPRIGRDRQTLIMSGSAILQALLRAWPTDRLSVADRGLREGLLYAQMSRDGVLEE
jgi:exopolyphosphatase/guanosine-5'-triphosphate,3'-diphosphate pyrophosphatase